MRSLHSLMLGELLKSVYNPLSQHIGVMASEGNSLVSYRPKIYHQQLFFLLPSFLNILLMCDQRPIGQTSSSKRCRYTNMLEDYIPVKRDFWLLRTVLDSSFFMIHRSTLRAI